MRPCFAPGIAREGAQVLFRAQKDRSNARIGDKERVFDRDLVRVPLAFPSEIDQGEVAVVVFLFGPHVVVDKRGIVARVFTDTAYVDHVARAVPVRQVVTTRFPRMGNRYDPGSLGVARAVPPFVPCIDAADEPGSPVQVQPRRAP